MEQTYSIEELQQYYANALETGNSCIGHKKADRNYQRCADLKKRLKEMDAAPDPELKGIFNGIGCS